MRLIFLHCLVGRGSLNIVKDEKTKQKLKLTIPGKDIFYKIMQNTSVPTHDNESNTEPACSFYSIFKKQMTAYT
jgi:hypothetical protein